MDGLRIIETFNWSGRALELSRTALPEIKRERMELDSPGVYVLIGSDVNTGEGMIYVGKADSISDRLTNHDGGKDFWTKVIAFVSSRKSLTSTHAEILESRMIRLARHANRVRLDNKSSPAEPHCPEQDIGAMEIFQENVLIILREIGVTAFETPMPAKAVSAPVSSATRTTVNASTLPQPPESTLERFVAIDLYCNAPDAGISAKGYESNEGFVVREGSSARFDTGYAISEGYKALRDGLVARKVLTPDGTRYTFSQDYTFDSPSAAACVVLGRSANGRLEWKSANGISLKSIQEGRTQGV